MMGQLTCQRTRMKMSRVILSLFLTLSLCSPLSAQSLQDDSIEMLLDGSPVSEAVSTDDWWGLYFIDNEYVFKPAQFTLGEDPNQGTAAIHQGATPPLFMASGLPNLGTRTIPTAEIDGQYLDGNSSAEIRFSGSTFRMLTVDHPEGQSGYDFQIFLSDGKITQQLDERVEIGVDFPSLLWAGDLDGDESLDLVLSSNAGLYCSPTWALFLSSSAEHYELVKEVAVITEECM